MPAYSFFTGGGLASEGSDYRPQHPLTRLSTIPYLRNIPSNKVGSLIWRKVSILREIGKPGQLGIPTGHQQTHLLSAVFTLWRGAAKDPCFGLWADLTEEASSMSKSSCAGIYPNTPVRDEGSCLGFSFCGVLGSWPGNYVASTLYPFSLGSLNSREG